MAPDVPSVLIELGFLSNRDDEAQLINPEFRKKVAARLTEAVRVYRDKQGRKNG
jgi:N-acetylmuramoyl-L-alanine amidase